MDTEPDGAEWRAANGVWYEGQVYRAIVSEDELVLRRARGAFKRDEVLRWPLRSLSNVDYGEDVVAYKDGAFVPVDRAALEFQVGRGLVRLEGEPAEMRSAFDLIRRASKADPRQAVRRQREAARPAEPTDASESD